MHWLGLVGAVSVQHKTNAVLSGDRKAVNGVARVYRAQTGKVIVEQILGQRRPLDIIVNADPALIEDAILNLIINAIEAIEDEGQITVSIRREETDDGQEAIIEVADTGRGICEDDLKKIFNTFFTTTKGGTGLGLPAVRRIARAHAGRVEALSKVGEGSSFRIHLPMNTGL